MKRIKWEVCQDSLPGYEKAGFIAGGTGRGAWGRGTWTSFLWATMSPCNLARAVAAISPWSSCFMTSITLIRREKSYFSWDWLCFSYVLSRSRSEDETGENTYQSSGSQSRKPFAKGLLAILSWVIWKFHKVKQICICCGFKVQNFIFLHWAQWRLICISKSVSKIQKPSTVQLYIIFDFFPESSIVLREPFHLNFKSEQLIIMMEVPTEPVTLESFPHPLQRFDCSWLMSLTRKELAVWKQGVYITAL